MLSISSYLIRFVLQWGMQIEPKCVLCMDLCLSVVKLALNLIDKVDEIATILLIFFTCNEGETKPCYVLHKHDRCDPILEGER